MENEKPLFEGIDELERTYAPEELPEDDPERKRADAEERGTGGVISGEASEPGPVASVGSSPSGIAATPEVSDEDRGGASDDSETESDESNM